MREKDIHKLIEQENPEEKQRVWEKVCAKLNIPVTPLQQPRPSHKKAWLWGTFAMVMVCLVTLSVVLPIMLKDAPDEPKQRYCDSTQYVIEPLNQTLKEYSSSHNNGLLYVDWYSQAEVLTTEYAHINANIDDVVFFKEELINGETGEMLVLSVTDNKTRVDIFDSFKGVKSEFSINNIVIRYEIDNFTHCLATFEFGGYVYYMELTTDGGAERLTEVIGGMIK